MHFCSNDSRGLLAAMYVTTATNASKPPTTSTECCLGVIFGSVDYRGTRSITDQRAFSFFATTVKHRELVSHRTNPAFPVRVASAN